MLQQTQVDTVVPYYRRFVRSFPTVARLAQAPLERVLELWSGLGYYRRARNLHLAAQRVAGEFGGRFPSSYEQVRSLSGIGDYTARAILSIACNQPYSVLDGNVARVIARLGALAGNISQLAFRRAVQGRAEQLLSRTRPGDFNQAVMELGQTICLPRSPRCVDCPIRRWCRAYDRGQPERYPAPRPRRATELRHLAAAVLYRGREDGSSGRSPEVALVRGLDEGLLPDLWNFPASFGPTRAAAFRRLKQKLECAALTPGDGASGGGSQPALHHLCSLRHSITFRSIRVEVYGTGSVRLGRRDSSPAVRWFPAADLDRAAVSKLARKIAAAAAHIG